MAQQHGFRGRPRGWADESEWWRANFATRPYVLTGLGWEHYEPAWRYGHEAGRHSMGRTFAEAEHDLRQGWAAAPGAEGRDWDEVREAVRDAWRRATGEPDDASL